MGLYVRSLGEIPTGTERAYYVYLLDYGWEESLGNAVRANLQKMADMASRSNAVLIHGPRGVHFEDEVLSWHRVNGQDAKDILPAILVTTRHPSTFRESFEMKRSRKESRDALLLIPIRKVCKSAEDVVELIQRVFEDIKDKKQLSKFRAAKRMRRGVAGALVDAVILQPKVGGIGFDLKKFSPPTKEIREAHDNYSSPLLGGFPHSVRHGDVAHIAATWHSGHDTADAHWLSS